MQTSCVLERSTHSRIWVELCLSIALVLVDETSEVCAMLTSATSPRPSRIRPANSFSLRRVHTLLSATLHLLSITPRRLAAPEERLPSATSHARTLLEAGHTRCSKPSWATRCYESFFRVFLHSGLLVRSGPLTTCRVPLAADAPEHPAALPEWGSERCTVGKHTALCDPQARLCAAPSHTVLHVSSLHTLVQRPTTALAMTRKRDTSRTSVSSTDTANKQARQSNKSLGLVFRMNRNLT